MFGKKGSSEYLFELLKAEDIDLCTDLIIKAVGGQQTRSNRDAVKYTLKNPNVITLVAKSEERITGVIYGLVPPSLVPPFPVQPPRIFFVGVADQESAMKGLPGMLIDEFVSESKKRFPNPPYVDTILASKDTKNVALYSSKGFSVEGFVKDDLGGMDVIILRKRLLAQEISKTPVV